MVKVIDRGLVKKTLKKEELLKECVKVLQKDYVSAWCKQNLEGKPQTETINILVDGVFSEDLTVRDALNIALIIGVQWNVKFEGVP